MQRRHISISFFQRPPFATTWHNARTAQTMPHIHMTVTSHQGGSVHWSPMSLTLGLGLWLWNWVTTACLHEWCWLPMSCRPAAWRWWVTVVAPSSGCCCARAEDVPDIRLLPVLLLGAFPDGGIERVDSLFHSSSLSLCKGWSFIDDNIVFQLMTLCDKDISGMTENRWVLQTGYRWRSMQFTALVTFIFGSQMGKTSFFQPGKFLFPFCQCKKNQKAFSTSAKAGTFYYVMEQGTRSRSCLFPSTTAFFTNSKHLATGCMYIKVYHLATGCMHIKVYHLATGCMYIKVYHLATGCMYIKVYHLATGCMHIKVYHLATGCMHIKVYHLATGCMHIKVYHLATGCMHIKVYHLATGCMHIKVYHLATGCWYTQVYDWCTVKHSTQPQSRFCFGGGSANSLPTNWSLSLPWCKSKVLLVGGGVVPDTLWMLSSPSFPWAPQSPEES